jgi:hypothetical protein
MIRQAIFSRPRPQKSSVGGFQNQTAANATAELLTVGGRPVYSLHAAVPGLLERWRDEERRRGHARRWRRLTVAMTYCKPVIIMTSPSHPALRV